MIDYDNFYNQLWGEISSSIISEEFVLQNKEFIDTVTFDLYRIYEMDGNTSITLIRRILVSILFSTFTFKIKNDR